MNIGSIGSISSYKFKQDPDEYAKQYANKLGITVDEAKELLKTQYGDPKEGANASPIGQSSSQSVFGVQSINTNNNINSSSINSTQGPSNSFGLQASSSASESKLMCPPEEAAEHLAEEFGMSTEEAMEILKQLYGNPQMQ